jgi:hypothetical protein
MGLCVMRRSRGGDCEHGRFLGGDAVLWVKLTSVSEKHTASIFRVEQQVGTYFLILGGCLTLLFDLKMEAVYVFAVNFYRFTRHHIPEDMCLHYHRC